MARWRVSSDREGSFINNRAEGAIEGKWIGAMVVPKNHGMWRARGPARYRAFRRGPIVNLQEVLAAGGAPPTHGTYMSYCQWHSGRPTRTEINSKFPTRNLWAQENTAQKPPFQRYQRFRENLRRRWMCPKSVTGTPPLVTLHR